MSPLDQSKSQVLTNQILLSVQSIQSKNINTLISEVIFL